MAVVITNMLMTQQSLTVRYLVISLLLSPPFLPVSAISDSAPPSDFTFAQSTIPTCISNL